MDHIPTAWERLERFACFSRTVTVDLLGSDEVAGNREWVPKCSRRETADRRTVRLPRESRTKTGKKGNGTGE
ncbi:hypothetical protein [Halobiforma nitratireducens]|uniref:Uncharacterized protein n=1 Tax=Halobiforma nitratireducens JCM 10879 TaxID=1227454 RepID=M0L5T8_9EURY|nr:hypothetical protein [Halobiforma nitratireducens]EMA27355.1 hypothetical protein C446_18141 [Halobiforma nitratireducens JCM 10879]